MSSLRLTTIGYWLLIGLAACLLFPFIAIALYSSPFTDDFCMSSHSFRTTAAEIYQYYHSVGGRLPALFLIALPSDLAHLSGMDLYAVYPLVMVLMLAGFIIAMIASVAMIFDREDRKAAIILGMLFSALMFGLVPNLDELAYWMTGAACYMTAAAGACLYAAWSTKIALNNEHIGRRALLAIMTLCFITAALNEFTVFFLLGLTALSLMVRIFFEPKPSQIGSYAAIFAAICAGYLILLLAPGNSNRIGLFSQNRDIVASIQNASTYTAQYAGYLSHLPGVRSFAVLTACFAVATSQRRRRPMVSLSVVMGLLAVAAVWAYASYFIGAYSTGSTIPPRASNEIWIVSLFTFAIAEIILIHLIVGYRLHRLGAYRFLIVAAGMVFALPIRHAPNYETVRSQWPQLAIFWQESMSRNLLLSTTPASDVVIQRRTVFPSLLMGGELKETPDRLPNDCIARYYGKSSVVLAP